MLAIVFRATRILSPLLPRPAFLSANPANLVNPVILSKTDTLKTRAHSCPRMLLLGNLTRLAPTLPQLLIVNISPSLRSAHRQLSRLRPTAPSPIHQHLTNLPKRLATIPLPIAMYSKIFVGDPRTHCHPQRHMRRDEYVARIK
jgi:hypothetical protein